MLRYFEQPLNEEQKAKLLASLKEKYGHTNFTVEYTIKPEILGGLQVYFGDTFLDCSLSTRLNKITNELASFSV